eukprot:6450437-Pyramimonas_sp.AAC.2
MTKLQAGSDTEVVVSVSPQSRASLAAYFKCTPVEVRPPCVIRNHAPDYFAPTQPSLHPPPENILTHHRLSTSVPHHPTHASC